MMLTLSDRWFTIQTSVLLRTAIATGPGRRYGPLIRGLAPLQVPLGGGRIGDKLGVAHVPVSSIVWRSTVTPYFV